MIKHKIDIENLGSEQVLENLQTISRRIVTNIILESNKIFKSMPNYHSNIVVGIEIMQYILDYSNFVVLTRNNTKRNIELIGHLHGINVYMINNDYVKSDEFMFFENIKILNIMFREKKLERILNDK